MDAQMMAASCRICLLSETNCQTCNIKQYKETTMKPTLPPEFVPYPVTGYTPPVTVQPATHAQLIALRDLLLEHGDTNAAAAADNLIDILCHVANTAENVEVRSSPELMGGVRYCSELDERKAQADAICEEYEAQDADWHAQVTELRGGL
jgi:hypothetical protein